ncbi:TPA: aminodeoxychorismate lyase, partial [Stenotrophomonas maltophilia]
GDGSGAHVFSPSLDQHNAAVARYLQQLRQQRTQETPAQ